jgi:two-component system NtrC family sensor kinase
MRRREFITLLGGAVAWPPAARAQPAEDRMRVLLFRILSLEAEGAAATITQFLKEMESQIGWTTQLPWSAGTIEQRRFDALRLLRQVPAVTELSLLDASGKEQLRVSRLTMDGVGSNLDLSRDPKFVEAVAHQAYYGPVYFRRESEPYMTLALAGTRRESGVSVAEVGLKLVWDLIRHPRVSEHNVAYVLDAQDHIVGHSDMFTRTLDAQGQAVDHVDLNLFQRDLSGLAQVQAARAASPSATTQAHVARDINGRDVLAASAGVAVRRLGWHVFVELPVAEAYMAVP